jgi:hypothetical protein
MILRDVTWPDATTEVAAYLIQSQSVPVRWAVPTTRPVEFLVVRRSGSGAPSTWGDRAAMDVECWSGEPNGNPKPAHLLAATIRQLLIEMPAADNPISHTTVTGVAFLPDAVSRCPRVILGVEVLLRPTDALSS